MAAALLAPVTVPARTPQGAEGDPLHAPACRGALDELQRAEQAASAARAASPVPAELVAARRRVVQTCLAGPPDPPPQRPTTVQPPIGVPLVTMPATRQPIAAPGPAVQVPTPRAPVTITACDPTGCWASDGTRLQRAGPQLLGPRGLCNTAGALLNCP